METQIKTYDYTTLGNMSEVVKGSAERIKRYVISAGKELIEIGMELINMKGILPHGEFGKWLDAEFGWSHQTACNYMSVAKAFSQNSNDLNFTPTVLYLLSSPSVTDEAREEAIERANAGEVITPATAKEIKQKHAVKEEQPEEEPIDNDETSRPQESTAFDGYDTLEQQAAHEGYCNGCGMFHHRCKCNQPQPETAPVAKAYRWLFQVQTDIETTNDQQELEEIQNDLQILLTEVNRKLAMLKLGIYTPIHRTMELKRWQKQRSHSQIQTMVLLKCQFNLSQQSKKKPIHLRSATQ